MKILYEKDINLMITVSVIIPVRNEASTIISTLNNIIGQDYTKDRFEVIVADGMSDDGTYEILKEYCGRYGFIKLIINEKRVVPAGLNMAIELSMGDVIIRMDAHSFYPQNYISTLVKALEDNDADNVGCVIRTIPANNGLVAQAIAIALSSPFGVGNSLFRTGVTKPVYVDTVPFGCFKREVFDKIGLFDEELVRNQDDEFNARMVKNKMKILLIPDVVVKYIARESIGKLSKMLFQYGLFKPLVNKKIEAVATVRQLIPLVFTLFVISGVFAGLFSQTISYPFLVGVLFYLLIDLLFSAKQAIKESNTLLLPMLIVIYPIMHLSYGLGYLKGLWRLAVKKKSTVNLSR